MLQFCVVLLCFLSTHVEGIPQFGTANEHVAAVSSIATSNNKTVDSSSIKVNSSLIVDNAAGNMSVLINTSSEPTEIKTEAAPNLPTKHNDQQLPEAPKLPTKHQDQQIPNGIFSRTGAALRGLYVFVGLSAVVMLYIAVKLVRLRRKKMRIRKYGLIANADDVEMTPLGADDDDEDTTLFDAHNHIGR